LAGGIEVGDLEHLALAGSDAQLLGSGLVRPDQRDHPRGHRFRGRLHRFAAQAHEFDRIGKIEGAGSDQGGVFAKRKAADRGRFDRSDLGFQRLIGHQAGDQDRRLADVGAGEFGFRPLGDHR
jgi:hypothetical protein